MWSSLQTNEDVSFRVNEFRLKKIVVLRWIGFFIYEITTVYNLCRSCRAAF